MTSSLVKTFCVFSLFLVILQKVEAVEELEAGLPVREEILRRLHHIVLVIAFVGGVTLIVDHVFSQRIDEIPPGAGSSVRVQQTGFCQANLRPASGVSHAILDGANSCDQFFHLIAINSNHNVCWYVIGTRNGRHSLCPGTDCVAGVISCDLLSHSSGVRHNNTGHQ